MEYLNIFFQVALIKFTNAEEKGDRSRKNNHRKITYKVKNEVW